MAERRRRKGFKLSEMIEGLGTSLSDTLQDKVEQEIKEADHSRNHEEEQVRERWLREEEGSGVNTMEMQGRRHGEDKQGRLEEMIQRMELGNGGDRHTNLGTFKPIKPRMYPGERNSITLTRWIRETELFLVQSHVERELWVMVSSCFLDGAVQHWYMSEESTLEFASWTEFKRELRQYFIPRNEHLRLVDEWRGRNNFMGELPLPNLI